MDPAKSEDFALFTQPCQKVHFWPGVLLAFVGFVCAFRPFAGMDFHWHLAMGRAILEQGPYLTTDPISHLSLVRDPDMGAWLGQLTFAALESWGGWKAIQCALALSLALAVLSVYQQVRLRVDSWIMPFLAASFFLATSIHRLRGRPDLFSLLFFVLLVHQITRPQLSQWWRRLGLVLLTGLWVNVHPAAIVAPILCLLTPSELSFTWRKRFVDAALVALSLCCTPFGPIRTLTLAWRTARTGPFVPEWRSILVQDWRVFWPEFILLGLAALAVLRLFRAKSDPESKTSRAEILSALFAFGMALRSLRLLYFLSLPVSLALTKYQRGQSEWTRRIMLAVALGLLVAFPIRDRLKVWSACRDAGVAPLAAEFTPNYPQGAVTFLKGRGLKGKLFHPVRWGGYLGLNLSPEYRTAHDGRITLFGKEKAERLLEFFDRVESAEEITNDLGIEILIARPKDLGKLPIRANGGRWKPVYLDGDCGIFLDTRGQHWLENQQKLK